MKKMIFPFKAKRKPREKPPCHSFRGEREEKGKRGNVFKTQAIGACYAQLVSPLTLSYAMARCCLFSPHAAFKVLSVLNLIPPPSPFSKAKSNSRQMAPTPPLPLPFPPPLQCLPPTPPLLPGPGGIAPQPHFKVLFPPTAAAAWLACNSHTERAIVGKGTDGGGGGRKRGS